LVAVISGAILGSERERREKPAGLRTLILVCLGSAAFTMVSFSFSTTTGDSGRVAAQIVTGIGFLGAGVILHTKASVTGVTTAATIWMTAAIGLVAGAGYAGGALGLSLLVRAVLRGVPHFEAWFQTNQSQKSVELTYDSEGGKTEVHLQCLLQDYLPGAVLIPLPARSDGLHCARLETRLQHRHRHELLDAIAALGAVREIRLLPEAVAP
jgi:putative Mg2+ transporter-C (MgtC) family protein